MKKPPKRGFALAKLCETKQPLLCLHEVLLEWDAFSHRFHVTILLMCVRWSQLVPQGPERHRSCRAKISCRLERLWTVHRVTSRYQFRRNNTGTGALGLSLPSMRLNLEPSACAQ